MHPKELSIEDFQYNLPDERIAQHPLKERDASKLLVRHSDGTLSDSSFSDLAQWMEPNGLLVFNETRVIRARLIYPRGEGMKPIELFCLDPLNHDIEGAMSAIGKVEYQCMVGNAKRWKGQILSWDDESGNTLLRAIPLERNGGTFSVRFEWDHEMHFAAVIETLGHIPLPPYMRRSDEPEDAERYQTVYASRDGSVAAPTAGLHFTERVFDNLKGKGIELSRVVLHVGAGTFKPVSSDTMDGHEMHSEAFEVSRETLDQLISRPDITAVGTTSTRTLESLFWIGDRIRRGEELNLLDLFVDQWQPYDSPSNASTAENLKALLLAMDKGGVHSLVGRTQIIIAPGYQFRVVKHLITNFHQPGSTLILLVAAALNGEWRPVYEHALQSDYRFLSYGDSSLLHLA